MTIYLSDEEAKELEKFCSQNNCSRYSTLKLALRELMTKSTKEEEKPAEREEKGFEPPFLKEKTKESDDSKYIEDIDFT